MVTGPMLLLIFVMSIAVLLVLIIKFNWQPFLALLLTAIITNLLVGMPLPNISKTIIDGFGGTLSAIGIVIGLGVMLGQLLAASGATTKIAESILKVFGKEKSTLAVTFIGWIVSIPVFFDAAFVILVSLLRQLSMKTKIAFASFVTALAMGLIATHSAVIPTPGPLIVAENFNLNLGVFFLYAVIMTIPAVLVGGYFYGNYLNRTIKTGPGAPITELNPDEMEAMEGKKRLPSGFLSFFLIILPIALILANTITAIALSEGNLIRSLFNFIGDKNIALFIAVLLGGFSLKPFIKEDVNEVYMSAIRSAGMIIFITGAGGAFGNSIKASGIGHYLVQTMTNWAVPLILFGFLLSQFLRSAQGSTTVALVTTSAILGPVVAAQGGSPMLVALAVCAGGIGLSLPNDSGFWVVNRFSNFEMKETFQTWTIGGTITGLSELAVLFILSIFRGILPGL
ncbi:MAG: GntP family permease [Desulfatiglandales bacterium]